MDKIEIGSSHSSQDQLQDKHSFHPKNYDEKFKSIVCEWLEYELTRNKDAESHTLSDEKLSSLKQKRDLGKIIAIIAATMPLLILGILLWQIIDGHSEFHHMESLPQAIFISASFLSFIVIYTVLIKGMFEQKKEEEPQSPIKEAMDILHKYPNNNPSV